MKKIPIIFMATFVLMQCLCGEVLPLANPSFEQGLEGWTIVEKEDGGKSRVSQSAARTGKSGVEIVDEDDAGGSRLLSSYCEAKAGESYRLKFWGKNISGEGMAVYLVFYDKEKKPLNAQKYKNEIALVLSKRFSDWTEYQIEGKAPENAQYVGINLHSSNVRKVVACVDDFSIEKIDEKAEAKIMQGILGEHLKPFPRPEMEQWQQNHPGITLRVSDVAQVCSDVKVGFALLTRGHEQYVGFYSPDRRMTIGRREVNDAQWDFKPLPSKVGYDNHNYISLGVDRGGFVHISGNMHCQPLVYMRGDEPHDVSSVVPVPKMVGALEEHVTYPRFFNLPDGRLVFTYRYGIGEKDYKTIFNVYEEETRQWSRLQDKPLFEGLDQRAYPLGPDLGPDGYYHMTWVWRTNFHAAETNCNLSYARSKDLIHWETIDGKVVPLPFTPELKSTIVDPIPIKSGIINGSGRVGFDSKKKLYITYHKYDAQGNTQMYVATFEDGSWKLTQASDWDYRWDFKGDGSIPYEVRISKPEVVNGRLGAFIQHIKNGSGFYTLDPASKKLGVRIPDTEMPWDRQPLPPIFYKVQSPFPSMEVNWCLDSGKAKDLLDYRLRWESMPTNRDLPPSHSSPPTLLRLIEIKNQK